jgi:hypothetical protein
MIDDPLSLLSLGIWLMAAGMWPVGFLFGACSACCDECPDECSKCTHFYNGTLLEEHIAYTATITSEALGNAERTRTVFANDENFDDPLIQITLSEAQVQAINFPPCVPAIFDVTFRLWENVDRDIVGDKCNCEKYQALTFFEALIASGANQKRFAMPGQSFDIDSCSGGNELREFSVFEADVQDGDTFSPSCDEAIAAWLSENVFATLEITHSTCDCGACCSTEPLGCENTAEGFCVPNENTGVYREYQGTDTACDPDPCVTGACCAGFGEEGPCKVTLEGACPEGGDFYEGVACDPDPCQE